MKLHYYNYYETGSPGELEWLFAVKTNITNLITVQLSDGFLLLITKLDQ
jgi:hypothetical protein